MAHAEEKFTTLRFCRNTLLWLAALFFWASLLTFHAADPPNHTVWPPSAPAGNVCGMVGAATAFLSFHYLGCGAYALYGLLTIALIALTRGYSLRDCWLRAVGLALLTSVAATFGALLLPAGEGWTISGPGGVLGLSIHEFLAPRLQPFGTFVLLMIALLVGLLLAADELLMHFLRSANWLRQTSAPAIARGGAVVAGAGARMAESVAALGGRLATSPAAGADTPAVPAARSAAPGRKSVQKTFALEEDEPEDRTPATTVSREDSSEPSGRLKKAVDLPKPGEPAATTMASKAATPPATDSGSVETSAEQPPRAPGGKTGSGVVVRELGPSEATAPPPPRREPARLFERAPEEDNYVVPPLTLLEEPSPIDKAAIELACREKAYILEQTLNEFRLEVQVVSIETGPVITVFELKLAPGIKVSQIASLNNDMARALKAPAVRVVAPLPGRNTIGIEVPNVDKEKVRLKDIIEASAGKTDSYALPLYLGKDASGQPLVADLTRMPHLLIAGTTGSGKSVCVTSIIMSILLTRSPSEVSMILVDPKVVELAMYKDVPHLMCPIVTEMSKAESILDWAATKMDERYELLAEAGVKDIRSYNRLGREGLKERLGATDEEMQKVPAYLPYIVIVIDELADLMMTSAKEVEFYLCRLAQKSRAVGIHLIVSTQRPQANVVTGLIKSNLPCRIAFRVASRLDSRIVLDQNGGEVLMGQGDMLFLPPGQSKLVRAQGTFISDDELRRVVKHAREQRGPQFHPELIRAPGAGPADGERDELFDEAVEAIIETGRGSVSLLQRRLNVGYGRASRLVDQMYEAGIVGEYKGSQAREVLVTLDEWRNIKASRDSEEAAEQSQD